MAEKLTKKHVLTKEEQDFVDWYELCKDYLNPVTEADRTRYESLVGA